MHKINHLKLTEIFYKSFTKIETVHLHNTRQKQSFEYFLPWVKTKNLVKICLHLEVLNYGL